MADAPTPTRIPADTSAALLHRWDALGELRRERPPLPPESFEATVDTLLSGVGPGDVGAQEPPEEEDWEPGDWPEWSPLDLAPERRPPYHPALLLDLLPHLHLEPGWTLDYVYCEEEFGFEVLLYTRRDEGPHFSRRAGVPSESRLLPGLSVEPSPEGFFDLALFRILGERLYLRSDEDQPLFTRARFLARARDIAQHPGLEATPLFGDSPPEVPVDWEARFAGEPEEFFLPAVTAKPDGTAEVVWFWHTDWGGIQRRTHAVGPGTQCHLTAKETLVPYDCGITY